MARKIWLLESSPCDVTVLERQEFYFDLDDNPSIETENGRIDIAITYPLDGNFHIDEKALERARERGDGIGRLGLFGIAPSGASDSDGEDLSGIFQADGLAQSGPLYRAGDGSLVTWALDMPREVETDLAARPADAPEQLCCFRMVLPIQPPRIYPMTIQPSLQISGDDLPWSLRFLCSSSAEDTPRAATYVISALEQTTRESIFEVGLTVHVPALGQDPQRRMRLTRLSVNWPSGDGHDVLLMKLTAQNKCESACSGCLDPSTGFVSFPMLEAGREDYFGLTNEDKLRLRIENQSVLSSMSPLTGELEVTLDHLTSGVSPFISDVSGRIVLGFGRTLDAPDTTIGIQEATVLRGRFRIDLKSLFRDRLAAQHIRLQFPGRRFSNDQLRQLRTILRNYKFNENEPLADRDAGRSLLYGKRNTASGKDQYVVFNVISTRRQVMREMQGTQGGATETRQDEVDDIVFDLAMVGEDHRALSDTLTEIRKDVVSVLGTVRG